MTTARKQFLAAEVESPATSAVIYIFQRPDKFMNGAGYSFVTKFVSTNKTSQSENFTSPIWTLVLAGVPGGWRPSVSRLTCMISETELNTGRSHFRGQVQHLHEVPNLLQEQ